MMSAACRTSATVIFVVCLTLSGASAQQNETRQPAADTENTSVVSIVSGDFDGTFSWMAHDLAVTLNDGDTLRILPALGIAIAESVPDVLYVKAHDIAFVHSDLLTYIERHKLDEIAESRLRYIAKLHLEEVVIVAGKAIQNISDLAGKKVNFGRTSSSNFTTSALIFELLGIDVEKVQISQAQAIEKIGTGEIAATVLIDDKPNKTIAGVSPEDGLHLLPIEYTDGLQSVYLPAALTNEDYPNLIPSDQSVKSIGVAVVMALVEGAPDSSRHTRVARFVEAFFSKFAQFREPSRHPAWREVDLTTALPGWSRFKPADEWLSQNGNPVSVESAMSKLRVAFQKFLERRTAGSGRTLTEAQEQVLFKEFLGWEENPEQATIHVHMTTLEGVGKLIGTVSARNIVITVGGTSETALLLKPDLKGLPPGPHAFHIHVNPDCGPAQKDGEMVAGLGAGGHLYLTQDGKTYGTHLGDLPPMFAATDGIAKETIVAPRLSMADLLDRSLMIHASGSDTSSRLACGVVQ